MRHIPKRDRLTMPLAKAVEPDKSIDFIHDRIFRPWFHMFSTFNNRKFKAAYARNPILTFDIASSEFEVI
jgi:hypothetical protein